MRQITLIFVLFGLLDVIKCDWWENMLIYEINTKSFKDSDGDGIGDINGITSKLDYIAELGVDAIWLPGIYYATWSDDIVKEQNEIIDHKQLNSIFGRLSDFQMFITKAHEKGLKVLLDFVPGCTSKDHIWFLKSIQNETIYTDFYIWANPKGIDENNNEIPPRGQECFLSEWVFNEMRKQFYCTKNQRNSPKINLKNSNVLEEMKKILRFWLDNGVDGFFVKHPSQLITRSLIDKSSTNNPTESQKVLQQFRILLDEYKNKDGSTRLLIADDDNHKYSPRRINASHHDQTNYYYTITHFPFNYKHLMNHYSGFFNAQNVKTNIDGILKYTPEGKVSAWASESHDRPRTPVTLGLEYISIAAVQTLLLPGVASIFYGQEIGLRGSGKYVTDDEFFIMWNNQAFFTGLYDYRSASCPMQWDTTAYAGFTNSAKGPWSDIRADYWEFNVEDQKRRKDSYYNFFKELIKLRKTDTCRYGDVTTYVLSENVFAFTRSGEEIYIAVLNLYYKTEYVELNTLIPKSVKSLLILVSSPNSLQKNGDILSMNSNGKLVMEMRPLSVAVLSTASSTK